MLREEHRHQSVRISAVRAWFMTVMLLSLATLSRGQCFNGNSVFGDGEEVTYTASYNWGPVWVDAGTVTFRAVSETYMGKQAYHFTAKGRTFPAYDALFKVRDYYDSWVDQGTFKSLGFRRQIYEGGYTLLNTQQFIYPLNKIISNTKSDNNPQRTDTLPMRPCGFDMLSAIYYTRTLDFLTLQQGARHDVTVTIDDSWYDLYLVMIGRDTVETNDGKHYRCVKFAVKMVAGTIFKGDEDVLVWVTDDLNKVPVYIEAKIIVGTVKVNIRTLKGLRNPVTSLVN